MGYPGQSEYQLYARSGSSEIFNSITYAFSSCPLSGKNRNAARGLWCGPLLRTSVFHVSLFVNARCARLRTRSQAARRGPAKNSRNKTFVTQSILVRRNRPHTAKYPVPGNTAHARPRSEGGAPLPLPRRVVLHCSFGFAVLARANGPSDVSLCSQGDSIF